MDHSELTTWLLWGSLILAIISEWLRPKIQFKEPLRFSLQFNFSQLKHTVWFALVPLVLAVLLQGYGGVQNSLWFAIGLLAPWLLSCVATTNTITGLLLLGLAWLLPGILPQGEPVTNIHLALVGGLTLYQLLQVLLSAIPTSDVKPSAADSRAILPAAMWLAGIAWIETAIPGDKHLLILQVGTAATLLFSALFRLFPNTNQPFIETYVKPLALSVAVAGGVCLLGDVVFHQPDLMRWSLLLLGAVIVGALFAERHLRTSPHPQNRFTMALMDLVILGAAVLVASRLFGTLGWVVAGLGISLSHIYRDKKTGTLWQAASLFFLGRVLLQIFLYQHNPNVTGINITHPYASAALFGGIVLILLSRETFHKVTPQLNLALWTIVMLGSLYFLHAEASGSLLVSALITGCATTLLPYRGTIDIEDDRLAPALILLPTWLVSYAAIAAPLMALGTESDKTVKLGIIGVLFLLGLLVIPFLQRKPKDEEQATAV